MEGTDCCGALQHLVAGLVAVHVVVALEAVDVRFDRVDVLVPGLALGETFLGHRLLGCNHGGCAQNRLLRLWCAGRTACVVK